MAFTLNPLTFLVPARHSQSPSHLCCRASSSTLSFFLSPVLPLKSKENRRRRSSTTAVVFQVDNVYLSTPTKIVILDHERKRTFVLRKDGLLDAVVWNLWDKKAKEMADFGDDEYKHMLCVESAAIEKPITLNPGEEWRGRQELSAVPSSYCSGMLDPQKVLATEEMKDISQSCPNRSRFRFSLLIVEG